MSSKSESHDHTLHGDHCISHDHEVAAILSSLYLVEGLHSLYDQLIISMNITVLYIIVTCTVQYNTCRCNASLDTEQCVSWQLVVDHYTIYMQLVCS